MKIKVKSDRVLDDWKAALKVAYPIAPKIEAKGYTLTHEGSTPRDYYETEAVRLFKPQMDILLPKLSRALYSLAMDIPLVVALRVGQGEEKLEAWENMEQARVGLVWLVYKLAEREIQKCEKKSSLIRLDLKVASDVDLTLKASTYFSARALTITISTQYWLSALLNIEKIKAGLQVIAEAVKRTP